MKMAYCTLLSSEDYLDAVLILNKSLRDVNSQYPLVVMVTNNIANDQLIFILNANGIIWEVIDYLSYSQNMQIKYKNYSVLNTASKLQIFSLKHWDKLVYIDADTLVLKNIDNLFCYPDGAMLKYDSENFGFSGLFVVIPKYHQENELYLHLVYNTDCFDGDLLGKLWFFIRDSKNHQIPEHYMIPYNALMKKYTNNYIIHYNNLIKPWKDIDNNDYFPNDNEGAQLYRHYLSLIDKMKNF